MISHVYENITLRESPEPQAGAQEMHTGKVTVHLKPTIKLSITLPNTHF